MVSRVRVHYWISVIAIEKGGWNEKIEKPLLEIKKYFLKHEITETEGLKLGLLFNLYGKYQWTLDMLYPLIKKHPLNNDLLFLFIKTYTPSNIRFLKENEHG